MTAPRKRLVGARFGAVIAVAVVFMAGLGWVVLPRQAPSTAPPQAQQAQRQADGAPQHHAQPQAQVPPHGDRDAAPEQGQAARDARRDGGADVVTWWSAVVTAGSAVVQAVSAAFTLAATVALVLIGRAQRDISAGQKTISEEQRSISADQAEISRQQMVIAHRPRLRVRNIVLTDGLFAPNKPLKGRFHVANVGGTKARITASHCQFLWNVNGLPMEWPYYGGHSNNPVHPAEVTANVTASFNTGDGTHVPYDAFPSMDAIRRSGGRIFFMGWIEYLDDNGTKRRTAFCREFLERDGSARFYPVDDPDYEYEE